MKNNGFKKLLYFAYGSLLKGVCSNLNSNFTEKVGLYLEGDESLEAEIMEEVYEELPHAILNLREMSRENTFNSENVDEYIFKKHNREVKPECWVIGGIVKSIDQEKRILEVSKNGENFQIQYLSSLEGTFELGGDIFYHHGWLIKK